MINIPLTVGGGIATIEDIELVFKAGADKVSMNSAAVKDPDIVKISAKAYGSERITVAVDARRNKQMTSGFELVVSGGTRPVGKDAIAWAKQCQDLGAGVILPTSMDGDGTQAGYDLEFTKAMSDAVDLPVVASGGAGKLEHFFEAITQGGAHILLAASVKVCTGIVTYSFARNDKIVEYLDILAMALGFNVVRGTWVNLSEPHTEKDQKKIDKARARQARQFHAGMAKPAYPAPSLLRLAVFRTFRSMIRRASDDSTRDYRFYAENGWLESDDYYPTRLGMLKKLAGKFFDSMVFRKSLA